MISAMRKTRMESQNLIIRTGIYCIMHNFAEFGWINEKYVSTLSSGGWPIEGARAPPSLNHTHKIIII